VQDVAQARLFPEGLDDFPGVSLRGDIGAFGMLVHHVVAQRRSGGLILLDPGHQAGLVGGAVLVADAVRLDELDLEEVGRAGALEARQQGETVAVFQGGAEGQDLQGVEVEDAGIVALRGFGEEAPLALHSVLPGVGLVVGQAQKFGVYAGLELEPGADDVGLGGADGPGGHRGVAGEVPGALAQGAEVVEGVGVGVGRLGRPGLGLPPGTGGAVP